MANMYELDDSGVEQTAPDSAIGAILQGKFALSPEQVAAVLEYQRKHKVRFGEAAVALGFLRSEDVIWALSQQFHYPYQSLDANEQLSDVLITANAPFSEQAEFFRDIRSQLLMAVFSNAEVPHSLCVTSAESGEGKTYFAANLAVAFSQLGVRTLLVDGDMRNPCMQDIFKSDATTGLSNILADRQAPNVVKPVAALPNFYLMPVGVKPPNPTELLQRANFGLLLNELSSKFDYIIIDTPALEYGSDALMTASRCGVSVALSRLNTSKRSSLESLVGRLSKCPTRFAGVIVNDH